MQTATGKYRFARHSRAARAAQTCLGTRGWRATQAQRGQGDTRRSRTWSVVDTQLGRPAALAWREMGLGRVETTEWWISRNEAGVHKTQESQPATFRSTLSITCVTLFSVWLQVSRCPALNATDTPDESFLRGFVSKRLSLGPAGLLI